MIWLRTALQIILLHQIAYVYTKWRFTPIRYVDYSQEDQDLSFDRVVSITLNISNFRGSDKEKENIAIGVMITSDRVLTSYNPFRTLIHNKTMFDLVIVGTLITRTRHASGSVGYYYNRYNIACGRQVQYLPDEEITAEQWHGTDRVNCPVHDLMVLRLFANLTFSDADIHKITLADFPDGKVTSIQRGLFRAEIATPHDVMSASFKFGSLGFRNQRDLRFYTSVRLVKYSAEDNALVDCNAWLPREWGHFICIKNIHGYPGLGASAVLVSNDKVFGFGSFAFFRGKVGIMVFTDVRRYYAQIFQTCTYEDSEEEPPETFPPSLEW